MADIDEFDDYERAIFTQTERKLRGLVAEAAAWEIIRRKYDIVDAERWQGGEKFEAQNRKNPDMCFVFRDGERLCIEVKETVLHEFKRLDEEGNPTYQTGRWSLESGADHLEIAEKDCYALIIDDMIGGDWTMDLVKASEIDDFYRKKRAQGVKNPRYPVYHIYRLRETQKCFPDFETVKFGPEDFRISLDGFKEE